MTHLILLPGLLNDERLWTHQRQALGGLAEVSVGDITKDDTMAGMAKRILDGAPPKFALAGLSMGGYVAFEIIRQAPERVERLALVDTTARPDTPETTEKRKGAIGLVRRGHFDRIMPSMLPLLLHPGSLANPEVTVLVKAMAAGVGSEAFVRQQNAAMTRADSRPLLPAITCPALVLVGAQDTTTPPDLATEMAAGINGANLVTIEECGHLSPLEQPEAVSRALRDWLAK